MVRCEIRVIYGDTDQMGVVYYANYLRWFEASRTEFLRAKGVSYQDFESKEGLILPVAEAGVSYRKGARYDDLVAIEATLVEARRASARFEYEVKRGDELLATGFTVHACVDRDGHIRRLPPEFLRRIAQGEPAASKGQG